VPFAEARARLGDRLLFANGIADRTVVVDVAFEAARVVIRLNDPAAIRRVFALRPQHVQLSYRLPGRTRETIDVAVEYAGTDSPRSSAGEKSAQRPGEFADSTYLRLVLDLPMVGTLSYDVVNRNSVINMYSEVREVEIEGCTLSFQVWSQHVARSGQPLLGNFFQGTFAIPLNALDPKSMTIRAAHPRGGGRYEPLPWFLHLAVRRDSKARILVGSLERRHQSPTRTIDLTLKDYETADVVKGWLMDAANRCETWSTAPLKPIR
jgi:hypothetical protein